MFWLLIFFIASFAVCFRKYAHHLMHVYIQHAGNMLTTGNILKMIHKKKIWRWTSGWGTCLISCWYRITFVRICAWSCHLYIVFGLLPYIFIMSDDPLKIIHGVFYALKLSVVMVLPPPPPHTHTRWSSWHIFFIFNIFYHYYYGY